MFGDDKLFLLLLLILMLLFFHCVQLSLFCCLEWKCTTVKCLQIFLLIPSPLHLVVCIRALKLTVGCHLTLNSGIDSFAKLFFFSASCVCWLTALGCEVFKSHGFLHFECSSDPNTCCPTFWYYVNRTNKFWQCVKHSSSAQWIQLLKLCGINSGLHPAVVGSSVAFRMCRTGWVTISPTTALWKTTLPVLILQSEGIWICWKLVRICFGLD